MKVVENACNNWICISGEGRMNDYNTATTMEAAFVESSTSITYSALQSRPNNISAR